jgi:LacI family transcriptional regulator, galactose operon repressor
MATMRDVSREAGVSPSTVSRVLTGSAEVDPATRERVLAAIAKLDYRPNLVARGLRRQASQVIALVITDVENPFYTAVCRGVEDVAREHGYSVILCNADRDLEKEREYLRVVADQNASGVVLSPASAQRTDISPLVQRRIPVIAVDMSLPEASGSVLVDNQEAAALATRFLMEAGARRIACITGPSDNATAQDRLEGYRRALREGGVIEADPELAIYSDYLEVGGYDSALRLLEQPKRPDAIFVTNNRMVVGVLRALQARGVRIPEDVNVVGFDELPWSLELHPGLSRVRQPAQEIGRQAARLLIDHLAHRSPLQHVVLEAELVVGGAGTATSTFGAVASWA